MTMKFETKYDKQYVDRFTFLQEEKLNTLKEHKVKTLGDLSNNSKSDLRKMGFESFEINKIDIELQLLGLGLK